MLFALFAIPLIEEFAGLLLTWMKVSEVKASVKIAKMQKEVADMLGISQSYISRLEKRIIEKLKKEIKKYII